MKLLRIGAKGTAIPDEDRICSDTVCFTGPGAQ